MSNIDTLVCNNPLYRDDKIMRSLLDKINSIVTKEYYIMEVCGGQTNTIFRYGIEDLLPQHIHLIHGPGCPVCVTPQHIIDKAIDIASEYNVTICSFGDMLRVPGSAQSLLGAKANGADVRLLYSPLDIIPLAQNDNNHQYLFLAVGFETTIPIYALLLKYLKLHNIKNITLLASLFTIPAAIRFIANDKGSQLDALLAAGHVCSIMGKAEYCKLAKEIKIPITITGFEPVDIIEGIFYSIRQLENGTYHVDNPYYRIAHDNGNTKAQSDINECFDWCDAEWRGLGIINHSGRTIAKKYELYDAAKRFPTRIIRCDDCKKCISGEIMRGLKSPKDCTFFGTRCTPDTPIGASMVSIEGVCSACYSNINM